MHLFRYNDSLAQSCSLNSTQFADPLRIGLVGVVGTTVALISLVENLILFYVFSTSRKLRRQNYANPVLLAFFDSIVSFCYILTSPAHVISYGVGSVMMVRIWAQYMRFAYCVQHFALTVANYLLVIASIERYLANGPMLKQNFQKRLLILIVGNKAAVLCLILFLSFVFKATLYFETDTLALADCEELDSLVPIWLTDELDGTAWVRFWTRKICTIIIPFVILAFCNAHIVLHLRRKRLQSQLNRRQKIQNEICRRPSEAQLQQRKSIRLSSQSFRRRYSEKRGVRVATQTLVMVVGCYLISNSMNTVINIWEYFDAQFLRYQHYYGYLIASDLSVLLMIVGCALRLPIYVVNDRRIRKAIFRALIRFRYCRHSGDWHDVANLEKWSIVIVSNSLRSNLTGAVSQACDIRGKKSFDQLAVLVQNRRRFLVQMTISLGAVEELPQSLEEELYTDYTDELHDDPLELLCDSSRTLVQQTRKYAAVATPSSSQGKSRWRNR